MNGHCHPRPTLNHPLCDRPRHKFIECDIGGCHPPFDGDINPRVGKRRERKVILSATPKTKAGDEEYCCITGIVAPATDGRRNIFDDRPLGIPPQIVQRLIKCFERLQISGNSATEETGLTTPHMIAKVHGVPLQFAKWALAGH